MKNLQKVLAALTAISMLVSGMAMATAEDLEETLPVEAPVVEAAPVEEPAPVVEAAPVEEPAPVVEAAPVEEPAPVVEAAPVEEPAPVVEAAPVEEPAPVVEAAPVEEPAPVVEAAPIEEPAPVVEAAPVEEPAPVVEAAPVEEPAPVPAENIETPVAEEPVTETPAVEEPVTEAPAVEEPVTEAPAVEEPATEAPAVEEPATEVPVVEEPATEAPVVEEPVTEEAVVEEPATEAPVVEEPVTEEAVVEEPATEAPADTEDTETYNEDELVEIGDEWGYVDPEVVDEFFGELTPEMKFPGIQELKLNTQVSGSVVPGTDTYLYIKCGSSKTIVLGLDATADVNVKINDRSMTFDRNRNTTGFSGTCTIKVAAYTEYIIVLTSSVPVSFTMSSKDAAKVQNTVSEETAPAETAAAETTETTEENTVTETAESAVSEDTEAAAETNSAEENAASEEERASEEVAAAEPVEETSEGENAEVSAETANAEAAEENTAADETEGTDDTAAEPVAETVVVEEGTAEEAAETEAEEVKTEASETEQTEVQNAAESATVNEGIDTAEGENTSDTENETEELPAVKGWIVTDAGACTVGDAITLTAMTDAETEDIFVWQTKGENDGWHNIGYGETLTVEVTEENANNSFRFRIADNNYSDEITLNVKAEEAEAATETETTETEATNVEEETETAAEETEDAEATDNNVEESTEDTVTEETSEETAEAAEETEAPAEEAAEETTDETQEAVEESEEAAEETEETADEESEETAAEGTEEETEESSEEESEEETEEETEPLTEEQLIELGYRKVRILNESGADIYDSAVEEAEVIGHADFESEIWIKDAEAEGWAEIYSEDKNAMLIKLAEIEKQPPTDEQMLEMGYIKTFVAIDIGANIYDSAFAHEGEETAGHLDAGTDLWVELIDGATRARIYDLDEEAPAKFISLVDIIAILKPEGMEELPTREIIVHSTLDEVEVVRAGEEVTLEIELINFLEDDQYTIQWKYCPVDGEEFTDIENASEMTYEYVVTAENVYNTWMAYITLITPVE